MLFGEPQIERTLENLSTRFSNNLVERAMQKISIFLSAFLSRSIFYDYWSDRGDCFGQDHRLQNL